MKNRVALFALALPFLLTNCMVTTTGTYGDYGSDSDNNGNGVSATEIRIMSAFSRVELDA